MLGGARIARAAIGSRLSRTAAERYVLAQPLPCALRASFSDLSIVEPVNGAPGAVPAGATTSSIDESAADDAGRLRPSTIWMMVDSQENCRVNSEIAQIASSRMRRSPFINPRTWMAFFAL